MSQRIETITLNPELRVDVYEDGHAEVVEMRQVGPGAFDERTVRIISPESWPRIRKALESGEASATLLKDDIN